MIIHTRLSGSEGEMKEKNTRIIVYHGSNDIVKHPDYTKSRVDIDFGVGFYLSDDKNMASKWACNKNNSILNIYELELDGMKIKRFEPDKEWLDYVVANRMLDKEWLTDFNDMQYDILTGPTADDKLFNTIDLYNDGIVSAETAVKIINCMNYSNQIVLKSKEALGRISFLDSHKMFGLEKERLIQQFREDRNAANQRTRQILQEINGR